MNHRTINFWALNEDSSERLVSLPARWAICDRCHGHGTHDAWDGGMTREEMWEQGPEFEEDYLAGHYDAVCTVCHGSGKVLEVDENRAAEVDLKLYFEWVADRAAYAAEVAAERRVGA